MAALSFVQTQESTIQKTPFTPAPQAVAAAPTRRAWLTGVSSAGLALAATGAATATSTPAHAARVATKARIAIAGSGLAGLALAHRLTKLLDGARITVIDAKEEHNYQPGYTLVATGVWPVGKVVDQNADFMPAGVEWVKDMVAEFDPAANAVVTAGGQRIAYDYLIVAVGTHQDWAQIEGMDVSAIGQNGLTSVYPSASAAVATWAAMDAFCKKGGKAVMTLPSSALKCAGAPLKMAFMLRDRLAQSGRLKQSEVMFYSALGNVFSVKSVNDNVLERWSNLGIALHTHQTLQAIDIGGRRAIFASPDGGKTEVDYDFLHAVPPMRAPDAVKNSDLAWKEGPMAAGGWLEVDKATLQHRRYPNVFGLGDINGTPRGKTAATVKKSAPIVAQHVVDVIAGRAPSQQFDGYTSCPMIVREGSAMLIEFDYEGRLTPSLPMIEPLQESYFAWLMKVWMLKPAYLATLKGRV